MSAVRPLISMKPRNLDDLRFVLGAVLAVAVLVGFVLSLHLFST